MSRPRVSVPNWSPHRPPRANGVGCSSHCSLLLPGDNLSGLTCLPRRDGAKQPQRYISTILTFHLIHGEDCLFPPLFKFSGGKREGGRREGTLWFELHIDLLSKYIPPGQPAVSEAILRLFPEPSYRPVTHTEASAAAAKLLQSCLTLCDPTDGSPPASAIPEILQARALEWVAIACSGRGPWARPKLPELLPMPPCPKNSVFQESEASQTFSLCLLKPRT